MTTRATSIPKNSFSLYRRCPGRGIGASSPQCSTHLCVGAGPKGVSPSHRRPHLSLLAPQPARRGHIECRVAPNQSP